VEWNGKIPLLAIMKTAAGDVDVVERNFTTRLLTGLMNEIGG
jgi:hypothetical protein